jgi:hypothetical protein
MRNRRTVALVSIILASVVASATVLFTRPGSSYTPKFVRSPVPLQTGTTPRVRPQTGPVASSIGINLGGYSNSIFRYLPVHNQESVMDNIHGSGIGWIRIDVPFSNEERVPGHLTWTVDDEVQRAVRSGLQVDALLDYAPQWARNQSGAPNPADFATFAELAAAHLRALGVTTYEVYNEPNLATSWGGPVSAASYTSLLDKSYQSIKRVDSGLRVVAGGLAATNSDNSTSVNPVTFLNDMYADGAAGHFDDIADHPYTFPSPPSFSQPGNAFSDLVRMHEVLVSHGAGNDKIWITEYGAPTSGYGEVTADEQAQEISSALRLLRRTSWSGPVFLFDWQDNPDDGGFGITTASGAPKPAYRSVLSALAQTQPLTTAGRSSSHR